MKSKMIILIAGVLLLIVAASLFASANPDGLESAAIWLGFSDKAVSQKAILSDYTFWDSAKLLPKILASAIGAAITFFVIHMVFKALRKN